MYILALAISLLLAITGVLMIFSPVVVELVNRFGNAVVLSDRKVLKHRYAAGALLLIVGGYLFWTGLRFDIASTGLYIWSFFIVGTLLVLLGILFLLSPRSFQQVGTWSGREIISDKVLFSHPKWTGVFFIVAAALVFYMSSNMR